eukprot:TRINITY_DN7599_c1_g1_i1.p1 TRINITY_DN7599_c1_g1~~TRINITY_DN7599_c1_g1_i1.p1  ORF type:complete len:725 (+),score=173.79 TRINITY_DN7599_c1_g1_i1:44-2176(+)
MMRHHHADPMVRVSVKDNADECSKEGKKFVDTDFAANQVCLWRRWESPMDNYKWTNFDKTVPKGEKSGLFLGLPGEESTILPDDVEQGALGDCWLVGVFSAVAEHPIRIQRIFTSAYNRSDSKVTLQQDQAAGVSRVVICKNGWWTPVITDDLYPVTKTGHRAFAQNKEHAGEAWVSILEKSFAKTKGSYAALTGGFSDEAFADVTGWYAHESRLNSEMFDDLLAADRKDYIIAVGAPGADPHSYAGGRSSTLARDYADVGLVTGHLYSLLECQQIGEHKLCKIRNPHGGANEWKGKWSDSSNLWERYPEIAQQCNFKRGDDGTFWMDFGDVCKYFSTVTICEAMAETCDVRSRGNFKSGTPSVGIAVKVTEPTKLYATLHQQDTRGQQQKKPYQVTAVSILKPGPRGYTRRHQEFSGYRDVGDNLVLEPSEEPYLIVPRTKQATNFDFVLSTLTDKPVQYVYFEPSRQFVQNVAASNGPYPVQFSSFKPTNAETQLNGDVSVITNTVHAVVPPPVVPISTDVTPAADAAPVSHDSQIEHPGERHKTAQPEHQPDYLNADFVAGAIARERKRGLMRNTNPDIGVCTMGQNGAPLGQANVDVKVLHETMRHNHFQNKQTDPETTDLNNGLSPARCKVYHNRQTASNQPEPRRSSVARVQGVTRINDSSLDLAHHTENTLSQRQVKPAFVNQAQRGPIKATGKGITDASLKF